MISYRLIRFINKMTSVVTNRFHEVSIFKNSSAEREVYFCEVYFDRNASFVITENGTLNQQGRVQSLSDNNRNGYR